jgi:hypothetical protein
MAEWQAEGLRVASLRMNVSALSFEWTQYADSMEPQVWSTPNWAQIEALILQVKPQRVVCNNAVSMIEPIRVPKLLARLAVEQGCVVEVMTHDYQAVCPSQFLLNHEGQFCGVPSEPTVCRACLPKQRDTFALMHSSHDIDAWRQAWGEALRVAQRVVCFSQSSRALLKRAYPELDDVKLSVEPHRVSVPIGRFARLPKTAASRTYKLAVVGAISAHKGAHHVQGLADVAKEQGASIELVVIGTLQGAIGKAAVRQTGPYQRDELATILAANGVDAAWMPSICPETFSYVTHELIGLGVPVACFDLGAQAEAVQRTANGLVMPIATAPEHLKRLSAWLEGLP